MTYSPLELAAAFIQTGELDEALAALDQHLDECPADDDSRRTQIKVLRHLGQTERAVDAFKLLADPAPNDIINLSTLHEETGNLAQAIAHMTEACVRWPSHERLAERYIQLLMKDGQHEVALEVVRQQPPNWRWLGWEGDLLAATGDDLTATARYGLALAQLGDSPERWLGPVRARLLLARAHAYRRQAFYEQAEAHYREAETMITDDPLIPFFLGVVCYLQAGDVDAGRALCKQAYVAASGALRDQMQLELGNDPRLAGLLPTITG